MKKLPVKIDAYVVTECWTYYKLAILQAYENGRRWLASHMEIFMRDLASNFGVNEELFLPDYFGNILTYEEINMWQTEPDSIVEVIIDAIDQGHYIIMDLSIHETLFYGYDKEKQVFYVPWLNTSGRFVETTLSFDETVDFYTRSRELGKEKNEMRVDRRFYNFNITRVKVREDYIKDCDVFNCFEKLKREANGSKALVVQYDDEGDPVSQRDFYRGLSCLLGIKEGLHISNDELVAFFKECPGRLTKTLRMLYEHRMIILDSMDWIIEELAITDQDILKLRNEYSDLSKEMQRFYVLCLKEEYTERYEKIQDIGTQLQSQYVSEKRVLLHFIEEAKKAFYETESYEKYEQIKRTKELTGHN